MDSFSTKNRRGAPCGRPTGRHLVSITIANLRPPHPSRLEPRRQVRILNWCLPSWFSDRQNVLKLGTGTHKRKSESHFMAELFGWSHGALLCRPDAGETPAVPGKPGTLGTPASCRLGAGHGGSRRQGEFLEPRRFVVQTRCGRDARGPREAQYAGSAGILPAWGRPRRIKKARRVPGATALCCTDPMRARRPRSQAREARYAGSAGILPAWGRPGGSRRQGEFLKPRRFVVRTRQPVSAMCPGFGGSLRDGPFTTRGWLNHLANQEVF